MKTTLPYRAYTARKLANFTGARCDKALATRLEHDVLVAFRDEELPLPTVLAGTNQEVAFRTWAAGIRK